MPHRFLSMRQVLERVSLSKTEIYRRISAGSFPKPIRLSKNRIAFLEADVDTWIGALAEKQGRNTDAR